MSNSLAEGSLQCIAPCEPGSQRARNSPDVINVLMGSDQCLDSLQGKPDDLATSARLARGRDFRALEQTAIDQQPVAGAHHPLEAGAGHTAFGAMMQDTEVFHGSNPY